MRGEARAVAAPRVFRTQSHLSPFRVPVTLLVLLLAACATLPAADVAKIDRVLTLIQQRLSYMDDVARIKWNSGAPIEDLPRERELIDGIAKRARERGLDAGFAQDFFRAQIEAAKIMQNTRFREWRARNQPPFESARDLGSEIRPALDALTPAMLAALAEAMPGLQAPGAMAVIEARAATVIAGDPADALAREEAISPLKRIARGH